MKNFIQITLVLYILFFLLGCESTKRQGTNLKITTLDEGCTFYITGTEICDYFKIVFDGDTIPEEVSKNFYCLRKGQKYNFSNKEYHVRSSYGTNYYDDNKNEYTLYKDTIYPYPSSDDYVDLQKENITDVTLVCDNKIKYDSFEYFYEHHDLRIVLKNVVYLRPRDELVLSDCGIKILNKEIMNISYKQIINLLNNDAISFFNKHLKSKTALQWKAFWETEKGKDYYILFQNIKKRIMTEKISSDIALTFNEYDVEKKAFPCSYNAKDEFVIKDISLKIFDNIKMSEEEALKIENYIVRGKKSYTTKINYRVEGLKDNKVEISNVRLDFFDKDGKFICSSQLTYDNTNLEKINNISEDNHSEELINKKDIYKEFFNYNNMHAGTIIDIFENSIFEVFNKELESYDTDLKKKVFLESKESDKYKKAQADAKKTIMENGIETIVLNYAYAISNFDTKTNMFYIYVGSKYKDSNYRGPDKCIENFFYEKLPTKVINGEYCLTWPVNNLNKALEIENEKKNISIKLITKVNAIKKVSYDWYATIYDMDSNFNVTVKEKYDSTWSTKVLNCTTMKVVVYNNKTNEIYKTFEF